MTTEMDPSDFAPVNGYCSLDDLLVSIPQLRMAELTSDSGDIPDGATLSNVVTRVSRDMDKRFASAGYTVPITDATTLGVIAMTCVDIVKYRLFGRRDLDAKDDPNRIQYEKAMAWLTAIATKKESLPMTAAKTRDVTGGIARGGVAYANDEAPLRWSN